MKNLIMIIILLFLTASIFAGEPDWGVNPHDYEFNGNMFAYVDGIGRNVEEGDVLAVFVGDECRGISTALLFPPTGKMLLLITIFSNSKEEGMDLIFYDSVKDRIVGGWNLEFLENIVAGSPNYPFVISIPQVRMRKFTPKDKFKMNIPPGKIVPITEKKSGRNK